MYSVNVHLYIRISAYLYIFIIFAVHFTLFAAVSMFYGKLSNPALLLLYHYSRG